MAGIYIHIPFCKQACHYCNFHFSTSIKYRAEMVRAITKEIAMRGAYLNNALVSTIYFGGGTPSLLTAEDLSTIIQACHKSFNVGSDLEMTLEANPDDLNAPKTQELYNLGFNRLSIGIQSFHDKDLLWMNRSHNAHQSFKSIEFALKAGIENFSIDLIFGCPTTSNTQWHDNLKIANDFGIKHLSCYGLTIEEKTALHSFIKLGKVKPPIDEVVSQQFLHTMEVLQSYGYEHYEISNYALDGHISQHNSNYWMRVPYIGIGPSAHSYNGVERSWNIANNAKYIAYINKGEIFSTNEQLSCRDRYNEYVMTRLRTKWGCSIVDISNIGSEYSMYFNEKVKPYLDEKAIYLDNNNYILDKSSWVISDSIISNLFYL